MTVKEALRAIHKRRCEDCACINCEYRGDICVDSEVMEIVEALHLSPLTVRIENDEKFGRVKVGYVNDNSGRTVYPIDFKTKPEKIYYDDEEVYTTHLIDIGLLDEI